MRTGVAEPPAKARNWAAILTYHSLDETGSVISIRPSVFRRQMEALAASGTPVVPLSEIWNRPGALAITFDDGFANFAEHALPALQKCSFPATVFVVSGYCGEHNRWPSQPAHIPRLPLMSWGALRSLPRGISVGVHTETHPDLRSLTEPEMEREVTRSRAKIEQELGNRVDSFAYPYGAVNARVAAIVRREFGAGCGTKLDFVRPGCDRAVLPRLDAYYLKSRTLWQNPFGVINERYLALRRFLRAVRAGEERQ